MRSLLLLLTVSGLVGVVAGPDVAKADCAEPCHASLCAYGETVLEGTLIGADEKEGLITLRIDRIHGVDDGSFHVGDTVETYSPPNGEIDGGLMFAGRQGSPYGILAIRSGEVLCPYSERGLPLATAIDIALSDDCQAAAEKALGPIPECNDTVSITDCTSGPGATNLLTIAFACTLFAAVRRRRRPATPGRASPR